ncbi:MAG TPA: cytochrome P460 family protein [Phycisphaerae bacterium]|jgi:hypothetical protein
MSSAETTESRIITRRLPRNFRAAGVYLLLASFACTPTPIGSSMPGNGNGASNANGGSNANANVNSVSNANVANNNSAGGIEPVFPANYRESYTEVRDCRFSIEHGGVTIRVLANSIAVQPYLDNADPLPVGSVLVKEEYSGEICTNDAMLVRWRVMRKEAPGFDPADGDWHWQNVAPDRRVIEDTNASCIACHRLQDCLARDYMCTLP